MLDFLKKPVVIGFVFLIVIGAIIGVVAYKKATTPLPVEKVEEPKETGPKYEVIGKSVEGRKIESYTFGEGKTKLAFVGGIHGGYEWNSVVLAYKFVDYLTTNPEIIPKNLSVSIIPSANPDGVYKIVGKEGRFTIADVPAGIDQSAGRFNAHQVDLNRNFDCKWKPESMWRSKVVSAGTAPFSEPEAETIRNFVLKNKPQSVVFWHSQSNAVYASECEGGILPETRNIMNTYASASGYPAVDTFDSYDITGDAEGWLASIGVPAITVELKTHETIEWEKNLAGVKALFKYYTK